VVVDFLLLNDEGAEYAAENYAEQSGMAQQLWHEAAQKWITTGERDNDLLNRALSCEYRATWWMNQVIGFAHAAGYKGVKWSRGLKICITPYKEVK